MELIIDKISVVYSTIVKMGWIRSIPQENRNSFDLFRRNRNEYENEVCWCCISGNDD